MSYCKTFFIIFLSYKIVIVLIFFIILCPLNKFILCLFFSFSLNSRLIATAPIVLDSSAEMIEMALNTVADNFYGLECSVEKNVLGHGSDRSIR